MGDASAYTALGLKPGADAAAVERAYKRLIKKHHPDRAGGDAQRAAEINRAYRELRTAKTKDTLELHNHPDQYPARYGWSLAAIALATGLAIGLLLTGPMAPATQRFWSASVPRLPLEQGAAGGLAPDAMDQPLSLSIIDGSVRDARHISRSQDEMALARASRDCHHRLRTDPNIVQLDRCAAFDDAVIQLQDRDPLRDQGPFSELAVTGRQWSGASALSDDYLAIDGRLDRIRLRVELQLAGDLAEPPPPPVP